MVSGEYTLTWSEIEVQAIAALLTDFLALGIKTKSQYNSSESTTSR